MQPSSQDARFSLTGSELEEIVNIALSLNKLTVPDKELIVNFNQMKKLADDELIILETGNAGEPIKALQRWRLDVTVK